MTTAILSFIGGVAVGLILRPRLSSDWSYLKSAWDLGE